MPAYKISFDNRFEELLDSTAKSQNIAPEAKTKSDIIRRAVALYVFLHKEVGDKSQGLRVAIIDKNSQVVKIIDPLP